MPIPAEVLKQIKHLEVSVKKLMESGFAGQYHSVFKGQGMVISDFREYVPGDDVRSISWNLTARTGKTYIKKYEEERELVLILAVDISGSVNFGSKNYFKSEVLTHLSALLGFCASKNNDNVGLLLFTDQVEHFVPPKKSRGHIQRILRDLYYHKPKSHGTKISGVVEYLMGILKKRSIVFLFSDFMDSSPFGASLKHLSSRHEVIAVHARDSMEEKLPDLGLVDFVDPESGKMIPVDTSSPLFKKYYVKAFSAHKERVESELKKADVDLVQVFNEGHFVEPLARYFKKRRA